MPRRLPPPTRRVNSGRGGHRYFLDGAPVEGVTTIINGGVPKPALVGWAARSVAERVIARRKILTELNDDEIMNILRGVPYEERDIAAGRGTEVHHLAAELARGKEITVPDELLGHVDAYSSWHTAWQPAGMIVEATVLNRQYSYMGTLDAIATLPELGLTLFDIKTGRSGVFAETALQLAAYGHAEALLLVDDAGAVVEHPMPAIDSYAALWLGTDSWEFYPMDVDEEAFRAFLYAGGIHRWMKRRAGDKATNPVKGESMPPPRPALSVVEGGR